MKINAKLLRMLCKGLLLLLVIGLVVAIGFVATTAVGKYRLYGAQGKGPDLSKSSVDQLTLQETDATADAQEQSSWQEGAIRYQGEVYRYNSDILTFLFLGIDKAETVQEEKDGVLGGQSDAIFLLVINPHSEQISVIGIPRDTITDIDVYDRNGYYSATIPAQLCLQHGYGDGGRVSCERTQKAVSHLFYDLPIHGYCAMNMGGISLLNDAIGGVELTALQDVYGTNIKEGQKILLKGEMAYAYLHHRDITVSNSAGMRLNRQKQYLTAYADTAKRMLKQDIGLVVRLYQTLQHYLVTDIGMDEMGYLATQMKDYTFDPEDIHMLQGEVKMDPNNQFEEFYADEDALLALIIQTFYEKIE